MDYLFQIHVKFRPETQDVMRFSGRAVAHGSATMMRKHHASQ